MEYVAEKLSLYPGRSPRIFIRLYRLQWSPIAPSLREQTCMTLDRLRFNKYCGMGPNYHLIII